MKFSSFALFGMSAVLSALVIQPSDASAFVRSQSALYCVPAGQVARWGTYSLANPNTTAMSVGCGVPNDTDLPHQNATTLNVRGNAAQTNSVSVQPCVAYFAGPYGSTGGTCKAATYSGAAGWYNISVANPFNSGTIDDVPFLAVTLGPCNSTCEATGNMNTIAAYRISN